MQRVRSSNTTSIDTLAKNLINRNNTNLLSKSLNDQPKKNKMYTMPKYIKKIKN